MTPQFEQVCLDRIEHLATMIRRHQDEGNYDAAILLSESAVQLTSTLDDEDGVLFTMDDFTAPPRS